MANLKPAIGLYVRDNNLNVYYIMNDRKTNRHTGRATEYQVECIKGPNVGKVRWIMESTIINGDFPVSAENIKNL